MSQGRYAGVVSALGIGAGGVVHACLAIAGVSMIVLTSPLLFLLVKVLGGGYLIYLGLVSFVAKADSDNTTLLARGSLNAVFAQAVLTSVLNPKVALFFIAFLPQFVTVDTPVSILVFLGFSFVIGGTAWCVIVAYFAASLTTVIGQGSRFRSGFSKVSGGIYIALGLSVLRAKA